MPGFPAVATRLVLPQVLHQLPALQAHIRLHNRRENILVFAKKVKDRFNNRGQGWEAGLTKS
jgi:hypothetical protein